MAFQVPWQQEDSFKVAQLLIHFPDRCISWQMTKVR